MIGPKIQILFVKGLKGFPLAYRNKYFFLIYQLDEKTK